MRKGAYLSVDGRTNDQDVPKIPGSAATHPTRSTWSWARTSCGCSRPSSAA